MERQPEIYFRKMRGIEENFVIFLERIDKSDDYFYKFTDFLQDQKITESKSDLKSFLYLVVSYSNNYHRSQHFFHKIELIITMLTKKIQEYFKNTEIFHIFQTNKRLLLFLFNQGIITATDEIFNIINNNKLYNQHKYLEYFYPEFQSYMNEETKNSIKSHIQELNESKIDVFNEKRQKGENDQYITELIRNDQVIDFISYINKTNISPSSTIQASIYETNLFLLNKNPSLIEYSAFSDSIQIFRYLYQQKVEIKTNIWPYAIHGKNAEIINFLEEQKIQTLDNTFQYLIVESIKCHHGELTDYFRTNFCENEKIYDDYLLRKSLKCYNFAFLNDDNITYLINSCKSNQHNFLYYLCKYDYDIISDFITNKTSQSNQLFYANCQYIVYKPAFSKDKKIVSYIEIQNGIIDPRLKEDIYMYLTNEYIEEYSTLLHIAVRKCNFDIIKLLLSLSYIDLNLKSAKFYKIKYGFQVDIERYLVITEYKTLLHEASESGYKEIFQCLLENKNIDVNGTLLINSKFIEYISTSHDSYENNEEIPLINYAIEKGSVDIIKLLLSDHRININVKSISNSKTGGGCIAYESSFQKVEKTPLYFAINKNNLEIVQMLLNLPRIDINFQSLCYISEPFRKQFSSLVHMSAYQLALEIKNDEIINLVSRKTNKDVSKQPELSTPINSMQSNNFDLFSFGYKFGTLYNGNSF